MTLHDKFYGLHILGTLLLWGGGYMSMKAARAAVRQAPEKRDLRLAKAGLWLIPLGVLGLVASGIALLYEGWGWFLGWLDLSILATMLIIPAVFGRLAPSLRSLGETASAEGLPPLLKAHYNQVFSLMAIGTLLMLVKPGTPMAVLLTAGTFAMSWIFQPRH